VKYAGSEIFMLKAWSEWKRLCAIDLCSVDTVECLRAFGCARFEKLVLHSLPAAPRMSASQPWALLESYMTVTTTGHGKRYKDLLFARVVGSHDRPLDVIQGGATLIMRDVVREFVRSEYSPRNTTSLHEPIVVKDGNEITLLDILPSAMDPAEEVCIKEYEELAREQAKQIVGRLSLRQRVAIVAKRAGLSLAHPAVARAARCKRTVLNEAYCCFVNDTALDVQRCYPDDGSQSVMTLSLMVVQSVAELVVQRAGEVGYMRELLRVAKKRNDEIARFEIASRA
jgi:hypothetical protein